MCSGFNSRSAYFLTILSVVVSGSNPGIVIRGCSSNGRAPALQAGSSGIDTRQLHLFTIVNNRGVVAQMVERSLSMREVAGSIPANSINLL